MKYTSTPGGRSFGRLLGLFAVALGLLFPAALQAQSGTGSITGRVLNVGNSKYLPNAVVTVEGTKLQALTDDYGEYRLNEVPAGEHITRTIYRAGFIGLSVLRDGCDRLSFPANDQLVPAIAGCKAQGKPIAFHGGETDIPGSLRRTRIRQLAVDIAGNCIHRTVITIELENRKMIYGIRLEIGDIGLGPTAFIHYIIISIDDAACAKGALRQIIL